MLSIDIQQERNAMKKNLIRAAKVTVAVLLLAAVCSGLNFAASPIQYNHVFLHQWKKEYKTTDTVFVGDSLTLRAVQPSLADKAWGTNSFNVATASQSMECSYYYLKYILKHCPVSTVYYGLDFVNFLPWESQGIIAAGIVIDRIFDPVIRAEYIMKECKTEDYPYLLFPFYRNGASFSSIPDNLKVKLSKEYFRYEIVNPHDNNIDKGYAYTDAVGIGLNTKENDLSVLSTEKAEWLYKIIGLCQENGVEIRLFQTPCSQTKMNLLVGYENYRNLIGKIADEKGVSFIDFNSYGVCRQLSDETDFKDMAHLNYKGSTIFMEAFCSAYSQYYN